MNVEKKWNDLFPQERQEQKPKINFEQELTAKYHFKSMKDNDEIYHYDTKNGIYRKNAKWLIQQECIKYDPEVRTNNVNDVVNRITWANYTDRTEFDKDIESLQELYGKSKDR